MGGKSGDLPMLNGLKLTRMVAHRKDTFPKIISIVGDNCWIKKSKNSAPKLVTLSFIREKVFEGAKLLERLNLCT